MTTTEEPRAHPPRKRRHSTRNFDRRLKAAGIDPDIVPEDADEFRYQFARMICMFVNK